MQITSALGKVGILFTLLILILFLLFKNKYIFNGCLKYANGD